MKDTEEFKAGYNLGLSGIYEFRDSFMLVPYDEKTEEINHDRWVAGYHAGQRDLTYEKLDAEKSGYKAGQEGKEENPYDMLTQFHLYNCWYSGYFKAQYDDLG